MATSAEKVVSSGNVPANWSEGADEVSKTVVEAFKELEKVKGQLVPAVRFARDDDGNVIVDEDGTPGLTILTDESGSAVMEMNPLEHRATHHGLHAYRYEECDDGSVVALYANDADGTIKMKAFSDIDEASAWSPRDERE